MLLDACDGYMVPLLDFSFPGLSQEYDGLLRNKTPGG